MRYIPAGTIIESRAQEWPKIRDVDEMTTVSEIKKLSVAERILAEKRDSYLIYGKH